jgi:RNA-directed DNA polymerase
MRIVNAIVCDEGFTVHRKKTRVMRSGRRQQVTGLVVNRSAQRSEPVDAGDSGVPRSTSAHAPGERVDPRSGQLNRKDEPRVPRTTIRNLRAAIKNRELGRPGKGETLDQLRGMAAYVHMCDPKRGKEFLERIDRLEKQA